jgi:GT2 family glycosyltransferase
MSSCDPELLTALVCTCNRGSGIINTIISILSNKYPRFELIVVDQSTNDGTTRALAPFLSDPRIRYIRSETKGKGAALNTGLSASRSNIVAITDDDCEVPADWLERTRSALLTHPSVAVMFCSVTAAPHDPRAGFIPAYHRDDSKTVRTVLGKCTARGIGAGLAVRRDAVNALGGFDGMLGPGAAFPGCDDGDIAVRALLRGYDVYETNELAVLHHGFRSHQQGAEFSRREWYAVGAAYAKPLRCGYWSFAVVPAYEFIVHALWPIIYDIFRFRRPRGFNRVVGFLQGFARGLGTPVDAETLRFMELTGTN